MKCICLLVSGNVVSGELFSDFSLPDVFNLNPCFSERVGELPHRDDPALPGRDEHLRLRLHLGSGV